MHVIADLCLIPLGVGPDVAPYIAACQEVLASRGLDHTLHATGTTIEGEWDDVLAGVRACHERVHALGAARIHSTLSLGTRPGDDRPASARIDRVRALL
ncbi:MAG: MTH1187 family thiamine-binding protein [Alphaproteobacteria bacterium]|nr:MTH1187 family thiamine-binding protein [Alphaproteobacteria bacterium]